MLHIQLTKAEYQATRAALRMYHEAKRKELKEANKRSGEYAAQVAKVVTYTEDAMCKFGIQ